MVGIAISIILVALSGIPAYAVDSSFRCSKIDNETPEMGPLRNQRVTKPEKFYELNEGGKSIKNGLGWCYAYAAADLVSHKLKTRVSAPDIAFAFNYHLDTESFPHPDQYNEHVRQYEGGDSRVAINVTNRLQGGFCPEKRIKSDSYGNLEKDDSVFQSLRLASEVHLDEHGKSCTSRTTAASHMIPGLLLSEIAAITEKYHEDETRKWFELAKRACRGERLRLPEGTRTIMKDVTRKNPADALFELDRLLAGGNVAVAGVDLAKLPAASWITTLKRLWPGKKEYLGHAITVVGRELDPTTGKCLYKFRNSWGNSCYDNGELPSGCKDGYIYIERDKLLPGLEDLTYLEP